MSLLVDLPASLPLYQWKEIPCLGGRRLWQLGFSPDMEQKGHPACRDVYYSIERGIHAIHYGADVGDHYPTMEDAMRAVQMAGRKFSDELLARHQAEVAEKNQRLEEQFAKQVADPKCLRNLWQEVEWLKERVQELEDRPRDDR